MPLDEPIFPLLLGGRGRNGLSLIHLGMNEAAEEDSTLSRLECHKAAEEDGKLRRKCPLKIKYFSYNICSKQLEVDIISDNKVYTNKQRFTMKSGESDTRQCPGCKQCILTLQWVTMEVSASKKSTRKNAPRYAFAATFFSSVSSIQSKGQVNISNASG